MSLRQLPTNSFRRPVRALQMWGGIECSTVRVGNDWRDQVAETGHHERHGDIGQIAELGIRTLRYPILWERVTADHASSHASRPGGWEWHDARMKELRDRNIRVIAGLLHHGSGPAETDLLDATFPEKLAAHAARAAARYPFIEAWTPVNEPLTTARFSCLYGLWFPHAHDEARFLRAVVNQCRAVLLSMRAIKTIIPTAALVQTEDLGRVFCTLPMRPQADYENERRWLSFDLLCGKIDKHHPWRGRLENAGVPAEHLDELATGEATPDVLGINHYVTSDRFLDHRVRLYPPHLSGGNGRQRYVDTEAARVELGHADCEWMSRLREAWDRYSLPMAVTEAHLGCEHPHEQIRWLVQAWDAARALRSEGADVRAVTAWALFGLVDWDSMLRENRGHYERGAFDAMHEPPRPTVLAEAVRALARDGAYLDAALFAPGWWRRDDRFHATLRRA